MSYQDICLNCTLGVYDYMICWIMCVQKTLHLLLIFMVLTYLSMLENVCGSNATTKINYKKLTHKNQNEYQLRSN